MKILVLGDIHGRTIWKDIVEKENPDLTIFLGDYVTTHDFVTPEQQINNLVDIIDYKCNNWNKVIMLRGNHDTQCLGYSWAECYPDEPEVQEFMSETHFKEQFLHCTQWVYETDKFVFAHAGISDVWMKNIKCETTDDINKLPPSAKFGFWPRRMSDYSGTSETQPCTWIRPETLIYHFWGTKPQIVGHSTKLLLQSFHSINENDEIGPDLWICDTLGAGYYMTIVDDEIIVKNIKDEN